MCAYLHCNFLAAYLDKMLTMTLLTQCALGSRQISLPLPFKVALLGEISEKFSIAGNWSHVQLQQKLQDKNK